MEPLPVPWNPRIGKGLSSHGIPTVGVETQLKVGSRFSASRPDLFQTWLRFVKFPSLSVHMTMVSLKTIPGPPCIGMSTHLCLQVCMFFFECVSPTLLSMSVLVIEATDHRSWGHETSS